LIYNKSSETGKVLIYNKSSENGKVLIYNNSEWKWQIPDLWQVK
jgi:hypothetical protein